MSPLRPAASAEIHAPIELVWAVMMDVEAYGEWNPFCYRVECPSPPRPGDPITLHVRWANQRTASSPERISLVEPPAESGGEIHAALAYVYEGLPAKLGLVRGTRFQRLAQAPGGPTRYDTVEEFSGPLVRFAGPERVREGFQRHADALKARAEKLADVEQGR